MKKILIINGSLGEEQGNTQYLIEELKKYLSQNSENCQVETLHLQSFFKNTKEQSQRSLLETKLSSHDGFVFTTGTYWDSWGSPLQLFLEKITELEASEALLGKPTAVLVTMHSVGGKAVLSRLQGVLNTMGLLIPPMSGLVYSLAGKLSLEQESSFALDFWSLEDLNVISHNLMVALDLKKSYKAWPVDTLDPKRIWTHK